MLLVYLRIVLKEVDFFLENVVGGKDNRSFDHEVEFHFVGILKHCLQRHGHAAEEAVLFLSDLFALLLLAVLLSIEEGNVDHCFIVD